MNADRRHAVLDTRPYDAADGGIHARRVAAAGQDADPADFFGCRLIHEVCFHIIQNASFTDGFMADGNPDASSQLDEPHDCFSPIFIIPFSGNFFNRFLRFAGYLARKQITCRQQAFHLCRSVTDAQFPPRSRRVFRGRSIDFFLKKRKIT